MFNFFHYAARSVGKRVVSIPLKCLLVTTRKSSCGKVMFSQVCAIPSVHGGGYLPLGLKSMCLWVLGGVYTPWTRPHPGHTHTHTPKNTPPTNPSPLDTHPPSTHTPRGLRVSPGLTPRRTHRNPRPGLTPPGHNNQ